MEKVSHSITEENIRQGVETFTLSLEEVKKLKIGYWAGLKLILKSGNLTPL